LITRTTIHQTARAIRSLASVPDLDFWVFAFDLLKNPKNPSPAPPMRGVEARRTGLSGES
jgi:hypothetical protein